MGYQVNEGIKTQPGHATKITIRMQEEANQILCPGIIRTFKIVFDHVILSFSARQ